MGMERLILDTNSLHSLAEAKKPDNRHKAFILGHTVLEEVENLEELLFQWNAGNSNDNLFDFGLDGWDEAGIPARYVVIDRHDKHYPLIFDKGRLREESRPQSKRTDSAFLERMAQRMANVFICKQRILNVLGLPGLGPQRPAQYVEFMKFILEKQLTLDALGMGRKRHDLVEAIRSEAASCFNHHWNAVKVACFCYAALLLEPDGIGKKTRAEFFDQTRRNVFGDTWLIQNTLWLNARVLSHDEAVKRMVEYLGVPEITVRGMA